MSKKVFRSARIVLGGVDVSSYINRWSVGAGIGELYVAEIDILDTPAIIEIVPDSRGRAKNGMRVPTADRILVGGKDISSWISGYDRIVRVGNTDIVRLYVQCDSESLSINDTTPWEDVL